MINIDADQQNDMDVMNDYDIINNYYNMCFKNKSSGSLCKIASINMKAVTGNTLWECLHQ